MTASNDKSSSGGDFDLPGFKPKTTRAGKLPARLDKSTPDARPARPREDKGTGPSYKGDRSDKPRAYRSSKPAEGEGRNPDASAGKFGERPARPSYGDKRPSYGDKPAYGARGDKPAYGDRPSRPSYGDRPSRPSYGDRPARPYGDKPAYGSDRPPRKAYGDKPAYGGGDSRPPRREYGDKPSRPAYGKPAYGGGGDRDRGFAPRSFDKPEFESALSPEIKKFLHLQTEKGRYKDSRFLIEGAKNVADVVALSPEILHTVLVAEGFENAELKAALDQKRVRTLVVAATDLAALCGTETPQGIVAVANFGALRPDWAKISTVTLLDGVQDPGNLGSILRTSAALGMEAVVLGKGTCDPYNPKVVRASAASLLRLPLETGEDLASKIHFLRTKGFTIVATSPHAKVTLEQSKLRRKVALLFGNEGGGVGENLIDQADEVVRIPMKGKVESLNVAVAHGLLTYDLMRLRK
jgi:TrmH family RNA methyltransferase